MWPLLLTLVPIALIDCLGPGRFTCLSIMLGTKRPVAMSVCYLSGVFLGYFAIGFLVLFGLEKVFERIGEALEKQWNKPVAPEDLIFQLIIGVLLIVFSWRAVRPKPKEEQAAKEATERKELNFIPVFFLGFIPAFMPAPSMLPYFAAIDLILKTDLTRGQQIGALFFYNVVFLVTPAALIVLRMVSKEKSEKVFKAITRFFATWGKGALMVLLILLGILLVADAIGLALGYPILPYNPGGGVESS